MSKTPMLEIVSAARLLLFFKMFEEIKNLDGDVVECGVGWGSSFVQLAICVRLENRGRKLWGFDSFEDGFPPSSDEDKSVYGQPKEGGWATDINSTFQKIKAVGIDKLFMRYQISLIKGFFKDTLPDYHGNKIALLHIDADLYNSYRDAYTYLFPKVVQGGIIIFDEYLNTTEIAKFPGAKKAIDETFLKECILKREEASGKYYAVKN